MVQIHRTYSKLLPIVRFELLRNLDHKHILNKNIGIERLFCNIDEAINDCIIGRMQLIGCDFNNI
jgi:hypothetical protein